MNKKIIIRAVLGIIILLASGAFWAALSAALVDGPDWVATSIRALLTFFALGAAVGSAYLIEDEIIFLYGVALAIILPFLFFTKISMEATFALLAFLFLILAARQANFEKTFRLKFAPIVILKKGLAPAVTALAILSALIFYGAPLAQAWGQNVIVPQPLFDAVVGPTMDLAIQMSLPAGEDAKSMPPEFKKQQAEFLEKLYFSLNEQIAVAGKSFKKWLPFGAAVSAFFAFKVIGTILSWLAMLSAWLIFRMLLWSGVVKIEKVAAEKEILEI